MLLGGGCYETLGALHVAARGALELRGHEGLALLAPVLSLLFVHRLVAVIRANLDGLLGRHETVLIRVDHSRDTSLRPTDTDSSRQRGCKLVTRRVSKA